MTGIRFYGYNLSLLQAPQELSVSIRENNGLIKHIYLQLIRHTGENKLNSPEKFLLYFSLGVPPRPGIDQL